jgi:hypothetical protein
MQFVRAGGIEAFISAENDVGAVDTDFQKGRSWSDRQDSAFFDGAWAGAGKGKAGAVLGEDGEKHL